MIKIACNITHIGQNHVQFAKHDPLPGLALASFSATAEAFSEWGGLFGLGGATLLQARVLGPYFCCFSFIFKILSEITIDLSTTVNNL